MKSGIVCCTGAFLAVIFAVSAGEVALIRRVVPRGSSAGSQREVDRFVGTVRERLKSIGVAADTLDDTGLVGQDLGAYGLVLFPYNSQVPEAVLEVTESYVASGGKVGVFYSSSSRLLRLVGLRGASYIGSAELGSVRGIRFDGGVVAGLPGFMVQRSWNVNQPVVDEGSGARVAGTWVTEDGAEAGRPALTVHPSGFFMGHVYLDQDAAAGRRLFLSLAGSYLPGIWKRAVTTRLDGVGHFEGIDGLDALGASLPANAPLAVREALAESRRQLTRAETALGGGAYALAFDAAEAASRAAADAYLRSRRSRSGELRGAWIHSAYGIGDWGWDRTIKALSDHGFNAIFANMLWGAVADYPSDVLPVHPSVADKGDQIALCLAACRKYGVELHVWKVNWNMGHHTPAEIRARFQAEGRTQTDLNGKQSMFLAPHIEANFQLERDSMLEVVSKYPVDGIHFDYIRYPGATSDFSDSARAAFEAWLGSRVPSWPGDCSTGGSLRGKYNTWRRGNISRLVRDVHAAAHRIRADIAVSAAVFGNWDSSPNTIAQATEEWIREGWLDFVCPMNYTGSSASLGRLLSRQVAGVGGRIPLYCGLGSWRHSDGAQTAGQIELLRRLGADGFICFSHNARFVESFLPGLALGITREPGGVLPHHSAVLQFEVVQGREALDGGFALEDRISVAVRAPSGARRFSPRISLARDGYACRDAGSFSVRRGRRAVRCVFRPSVPGVYRVEVRGSWMLEGQGSTQPLMARGPTIEVLSAADAARRELRNGPPRFSGRGIRVGVWQHSGYGSAPILSALQGVEGVEAAPLYNLKPDSLSACQVVVLTQPREQVQRFKDEQVMAPVVAAIHRGVGVLVTHALVGVRGFVNLAPGISSGGAREVGSSWRVSGEHPIGRGLGGMVHRSTFGDRIGLVLGADGLLIAETPKGVPVVAAGRRGRGRYVACGLGIGIGSNDRDADVSEPETTLLINAVRWLAGGR